MESKNSEPVLKVTDLCVSYGAIKALRNVTLHVDRGEVVALVGANGGGKSTLLGVLVGLVRAESGSVKFLGRETSRQRSRSIVRLGIALVPEGRGILAQMPVLENLQMGAYCRSDQSDIKSDMERVLTQLPVLRARIGQLAGTLSGGEQQMLAIGRGLMSRPQMLMLDEPSLGLAPLMVTEIFRIIDDLKQEGGTVLLSEQNARKALRCANRGYVLEKGEIVLQGNTSDLHNNPYVQQAYLGGK